MKRFELDEIQLVEIESKNVSNILIVFKA